MPNLLPSAAVRSAPVLFEPTAAQALRAARDLAMRYRGRGFSPRSKLEPVTPWNTQKEGAKDSPRAVRKLGGVPSPRDLAEGERRPPLAPRPSFCDVIAVGRASDEEVRSFLRPETLAAAQRLYDKFDENRFATPRFPEKKSPRVPP